jgi:hypothetical protein
MIDSGLKDFVLDYLRTNNAKMLVSREHVTVQVPEKLAQKLECEKILNITFDKEYAKKNENIDFITSDSKLFNKIMESMSNRGLTTLKCYNGKKLRALEFNFKVIFDYVDKREKLFSFLVNLDNKKNDNNMLKTLKNKSPQKCDVITIDKKDIEECYLICINEIKKVIAADIESITEKLSKELDKEKRIIELFYDSIISDLKKKHKAKEDTLKTNKTKAYTSKYVEVREKHRKQIDEYRDQLEEVQGKSLEELQNYFETKERRIKEIENQYKLQTKILLYSTALVIVNE